MLKIFIVLMSALLVSGNTIAIDEDYFIPYTDNYGYEYDPETGQYIKKEQVQPITDDSASENISTDSKTNIQNSAEQTVNETKSVPGETVSSYYNYMIGGGVIVLVLISAWFWKKQRSVIA